MNFSKILLDRSTFPDDAAFIEAANAVEYTLKAKCDGIGVGIVSDLFGDAVAAMISLALSPQAGDDPVTAQAKLNNKIVYDRGAVEMNRAGGIAKIAQLVAGGILTQSQADQLLDFGRDITANCQSRYGVETMTPEIIAQAQATTADEAVLAALQAQHQVEMDTWNAANARHGRRLDYYNDHRGEGLTIEQLNAVE